VAVIATAGMVAQRWGLVVRADRTRSSAHARPNARRVDPVVTPSVAPGRATMVKRVAAATPVASEPRTTLVPRRSTGLTAVRAPAGRVVRWTWVVMDFSLSQ
jgi:hypothetical protein